MFQVELILELFLRSGVGSTIILITLDVDALSIYCITFPVLQENIRISKHDAEPLLRIIQGNQPVFICERMVG